MRPTPEQRKRGRDVAGGAPTWRRGAFGTSFLAVGLALACTPPPGDGPGHGEPDASVGSGQALFEVPVAGNPPPSGFYALPFPNDIRRLEGGGIDLSDHRRPNVLLGEYLDTIGARLDGFSLSGAIFFRFVGPIDDSTLPASPEESLAPDASVYLVNIDAESPGYGERVPLLFRFEPFAGEGIGENWLSALPFPGFPLREETTYAAVVTSRVAAADGSPIQRATDFATLLSDQEPGDADLARAHQIYAPLRVFLDQVGDDERNDVASAAVFTTQAATRLLGQIREVIWRDLPLPEPREMRWRNTTPAMVWYDGVYDAPNFQTGTVPYRTQANGGDIRLDPETGDPVIERMEELRFSVTVPRGTMPPNGWPVVIYAHGTGGDFHSFVSDGTAARLGERGLAAISIDQVLHGPRNPGSSPEIAFFNFQNPLAARDNTLQGALDDFQLIRLLVNFRFVERHVGGRPIRFDPQRIYFFGHSQGGLTGVPFVAHEPLIKGAVLSGAGGILYLSMIYKTEPVDVAGLIRAFIRDNPIDEFNPFLALLQLWVDRADSVSYGPLLVNRPLPGNTQKHIFQSLGHTDRYTPVPSIEALATSIELDLVEPVLQPVRGLELAGAEVLEPPVAQNRMGITSVLLQYDEPGGSDGHFVIFQVPEAARQSIEFLATLAEDGVATLVAP